MPAMTFHERDDLGFDAPAPLGHPGRANMPDGASTGPALGQRLPDFRLTDHTGRSLGGLVTPLLHAARGTARRHAEVP
jgi:hypothetical protein